MVQLLYCECIKPALPPLFFPGSAGCDFTFLFILLFFPSLAAGPTIFFFFFFFFFLLVIS
ncbi:hypothetical protein FN846DRAFT_961871 [Sphaerosporella brunnea]|uniref:Uncharacterized protein n=1 Tax=Sphaerosporella brunnea TaxID=1250544 RepID=A0A5J5EPB6_9PEZI|nr:hypothetical protein FN846DRAFT_961871 [Sphaerosporella brunnea]